MALSEKRRRKIRAEAAVESERVAIAEMELLPLAVRRSICDRLSALGSRAAELLDELDGRDRMLAEASAAIVLAGDLLASLPQSEQVSGVLVRLSAARALLADFEPQEFPPFMDCEPPPEDKR